jgi:sulfur carrier protein
MCAPLPHTAAKETRAMITVFVEPDNETLTFARHSTVLRLQEQMGLRVNDALVICGDKLLTPDDRLNDGDQIRIRKVMSTG